MEQSQQKPKISVISTPDYEIETMQKAVDRHFALLDFEKRVNPTTKVLLKPNLLMKRNPAQGTTTHPALVLAVIRWLEQRGIAHITIADSPGGPFTTSALYGIYKSCGMQDITENTVALLNYDVGHQVVSHPEGVLCREFEIINAIMEADVLINLPKLKTHGMMQLSAGVKNLFGAVPGLKKPELHFRFPEEKDFAQMLVDLSTLVKPTITVVDAVVSMEGDGPSSGSLRTTGKTFAAYDVHALDVALCDYTTMPHTTAFTVEKSIENGLCPASIQQLEYVGDGYPKPLLDFVMPTSKPIDFMERVPKFLRRPAVWFGERFLAPRPVVLQDKCIGCGKCEESCAPKALKIKDRKAIIDYSDCIRCYCCHEMCPIRAIEIKRGLFLSRF